MEEIRDKGHLADIPRPCDYFDLIGGTSTGGLIAIMLGRLGMTVEACITAYREMAEKAFVPKYLINLPAPPNGIYSSTALKETIIQVVKKQCKEQACKKGDCSHAEMEFRDPSCTKTVVLAVTKSDVDAPPTLFKTYDRSNELVGCKIWEVGRATSAATTFFKSIKCGPNEIEYIDAGFGYNNPCQIMVDEARTLYNLPDSSRTFVLSIGTGLGEPVGVLDGRIAIIKALKKMATSSQRVADAMDRQLRPQMYYRFNVIKGLSRVDLADWKKKSEIACHTSNYLRSPIQIRRIEECVSSLNVPTAGHVHVQSEVDNQPMDEHELAENAQKSSELDGAGGRRDSAAVRPNPDRASNAISNSYLILPLSSNGRYVPRKRISDLLAKELLSGNNLDANNHRRRVMLYGLAGSGKTEIALQFAQEFKDNYIGVFWLSGAGNGSIEDGIESIAKALGVYDAHAPKTTLSKTLGWFEVQYRWLLIIDDIDGHFESTSLPLRFCKPTMNGHVILTSSNRQFAGTIRNIEIGHMTFDEGKELVVSVIRHDCTNNAEVEYLLAELEDRGALEELFSTLDGLPLALECAAAYMSRHRLTPRQYRKLFEKESEYQLDKLSLTRFDGKSRHGVMKAWSIAFKKIRDVNNSVAQLLLLMSLLHNEAIPFNLLNNALARQQQWGATGNFEDVSSSEWWIPEDLEGVFKSESHLRDALGVLLDYGFIRYCKGAADDGASLHVHSLVHLWAGIRLEKEEPEVQYQLRACAIGLVGSALAKQDQLPPYLPRRYVNESAEDKGLGVWPWRRYPKLVSHAHRCLGHALDINSPTRAILLLSLSLIQFLEYSTRTTFQEDLNFSIRLIEHVEKSNKSSEWFLPCSILLWTANRADLCRCRIKVLDENYALCDSCTSLHRKVETFLTSTRDSSPVPALSRALANILEKDKDKFSPQMSRMSTSSTPSRSAHLYNHTTDGLWLNSYIAAAEDYLRVRDFSAEGPFNDDELEESIDFCVKQVVTKRASMIAEGFKGLCGISSEEYLRAAWYSIATLDEYQVSSTLQDIVYEIIKNPTHSWFHERYIIRYADSLIRTKRHPAAKDFLLEVQEAYKETGRQLQAVVAHPLLDKNFKRKDFKIFVHKVTGQTLTFMVHDLMTVKELKLEMQDEDGIPPDQPRLIFNGIHLEDDRWLCDYKIKKGSHIHHILRLRGGGDNAVTPFSYDYVNPILPPRPSSLDSFRTYSNQGRWKEAEELEVQVLETKTKLGADHPSTPTPNGDLASTYRDQGRWDEAEELEVQVMRAFGRNLGADHPDTLISMNNLALTWKGQGRPLEAIRLMQVCVQLRERILGVGHPHFLSSSATLARWQADVDNMKGVA